VASGNYASIVKLILLPDFTMVAILRKVSDKPFVTPLDVPPEIMPQVETSKWQGCVHCSKPAYESSAWAIAAF
jgi:hypothetical protein